MKFYCMKCRKSVEESKYKEETKLNKKTKKKMKFAVATHSCGTKMYRVMGKA